MATYGRCLAYYQPPTALSWFPYETFCANTSLTSGTGVGGIAKLLGTDFSNIQSAWTGIMKNSLIGMLSNTCGTAYPQCPFWFNTYCPGGTALGNAAVPADLPNGIINNGSLSCEPGMLPANFGPIEFLTTADATLGVICEFGDETIIC